MGRILIATLIAFAAAANATSQTATAASSTTKTSTWSAVGHFHKRCGQIEAALAALGNTTGDRVVLLGDSITEKNPLKDIGDLTLVNMGISGDRIDNAAAGTGVRRRLELVARAKPKHIFLMIGVNDFWGGKKPVPQAQSDYTALVKAIRSEIPDATLHLQSVLPTAGKNAYMLPDIKLLNQHIKELAKAQGLDYIDLWPVMADEKGELKASFTKDGVHLTPDGYAAWNKIIMDKLGLKSATP